MPNPPTNVGTVNNIIDLRAITTPGSPPSPSFTTVSMNGYHASGDGGGGMFRWVPSIADPNSANNGTIIKSDNTGFWLRVVDDEQFCSVRWFGAKGDGVADDTDEIQDAIDFCVPLGLPLFVPKGTYLTGPLYGNGRKWVTGDLQADPPIPPKNAAGQQPGLRALIGIGGISFGSRFAAKPGAYMPGDAMFTLRNAASQLVRGLNFYGAANSGDPPVADICVDLAWRGSWSGVPGEAAPACANTFADLFCQNAKEIGIILDGAADSEISNINYSGGTAKIGLSMKLAGGGIWANNVHIYQGRVEIAAQNARISDSFMAKGVRIVSSALQLLEFTSCQFSTDPNAVSADPGPAAGYTIYSDTTPFGTFAINFTSCVFLGGDSHVAYFAGRWQTGAKFTACHFVRTGYFDTTTPNRWIVQGPARPTVFDFDHCTFNDPNGSPAFPVSVPGLVVVGTYACRRGDGIVISRRDFPGDLRLTSGFFEDTAVDGIVVTAIGPNQLTAGLNNITSTTAGSADSVWLPNPAPGRRVSVWNNSNNPLNVYPAAGSSINGSPAPLNLVMGQNRNFRAITATKWLLD